MVADVCWFCERQAADEEHAHQVTVYRRRKVTVYRRRKQERALGVSNPDSMHDTRAAERSIAVPRCCACSRAHGRESLVTVLFVVGAGLAGTVECVVLLWHTRGVLAALGLMLALCVGVVLGIVGGLLSIPFRRLVRGNRPDLHPTVAAALDDGWELGVTSLVGLLGWWASVPRAQARSIRRSRPM